METRTLFLINKLNEPVLFSDGLEYLQNTTKDVKSLCIVLFFNTQDYNIQQNDNKNNMIELIHITEGDAKNIIILNWSRVTSWSESVKTLLGLFMQITSLIVIDESLWPRNSKDSLPLKILDIFNIFLHKSIKDSKDNKDFGLYPSRSNSVDNIDIDQQIFDNDQSIGTTKNNAFDLEIKKISKQLHQILPPILFTLDGDIVRNSTNDLIGLSGFISHFEAVRNSECKRRNQLRNILLKVFPSYSCAVIDNDNKRISNNNINNNNNNNNKINDDINKRIVLITQEIIKGKINETNISQRSFDSLLLGSQLFVDLLQSILSMTTTDKGLSICLENSMEPMINIIKKDSLSALIDTIMVEAKDELNKLSINLNNITDQFRSIRRRSLMKLRGYFSDLHGEAINTKKELQKQLRKLKLQKQQELTYSDMKELSVKINNKMAHTFDFFEKSELDFTVDHSHKLLDVLKSGIKRLEGALIDLHKDTLLESGIGWSLMSKSLRSEIKGLYRACTTWIEGFMDTQNSANSVSNQLSERIKLVEEESHEIRNQISDMLHNTKKTSKTYIEGDNDDNIDDSTHQLLSLETKALEDLIQSTDQEHNDMTNALIELCQETELINNEIHNHDHHNSNNITDNGIVELLQRLNKAINLESELIPQVVLEHTQRSESVTSRRAKSSLVLLEEFNQSLESYKVDLDVVVGKRELY